MNTGETQLDSTPRWEAIADDFLGLVTVEEVAPLSRTTSIAEPISYMRLCNPKRAAEMQQRREDLVGQRELSSIDPKVRSFSIGSSLNASVETVSPQQISAGLRQARRLVAVARDIKRGLPESTKRNPELVTELKAEHEATTGCRKRAASDPELLDTRLD